MFGKILTNMPSAFPFWSHFLRYACYASFGDFKTHANTIAKSIISGRIKKVCPNDVFVSIDTGVRNIVKSMAVFRSWNASAKNATPVAIASIGSDMAEIRNMPKMETVKSVARGNLPESMSALTPMLPSFFPVVLEFCYLN
ncbi:MAG: hypothetical protein HY394_04555 [Candidatus Diapherotrites archaeon]|nr:hypothetical protein [Candidatus Diapherotrites archaeon]